MPSLGEANMSTHTTSATDLIREARARERATSFPEAIECYEAAIAAAERDRDQRLLAEGLRRLAVLRRQRGQTREAWALGLRGYNLACDMEDDLLAAEALNTLGGLDLTTGNLNGARAMFVAALERGGSDRSLCARVEQNLGILANIQGDLPEALERYRRSLIAYEACGDEHGCALAYHNLGLACADRELHDAAARHFDRSFEIAERLQDLHLQGLCLVNHAAVDIASQRFENARQKAEQALDLFDHLGAQDSKSVAYRVLGMVYRETGSPELAETRLLQAVDLARQAGSVLSEAESHRELALLSRTLGRNRQMLRYLNLSYQLFKQLDARADLIDVGGKVAELEATYREVVRQWGLSIERVDPYTFGHCERVARAAVSMARHIGLDRHGETTVLLGAYLHDVGKLQVPHEVLNKSGELTPSEREMLRRHPVWGVDLLADVDFPWAIKSVIRSHHERCDGSGYPDGLSGEAIPLAAQIVGILDLYDEMTTPRWGRPARSHRRAVVEISRRRRWWSDSVFEAFLAVTDGVEDMTQRRAPERRRLGLHSRRLVPPERKPS
jgi:putative nucleotidyltransferase with HDIG domain